MKNWKRFIAACLSVTMVASIPFTAFAESSVSVKELVPKTSNKSETQEETDLEKILSQEKPYEYFSGLKDQEKLLDACKDEELFQLKEYMKYAYIHESDLKNRQSLDAYLTISEAWKNRNVTFDKDEQEKLLQLPEKAKVYGTKFEGKDEEGKSVEKTVKDFSTYMEYLQSIKKFDVPKYMEILSAFDEVKTEEDLAKAKEAYSNFEEETFGFDEQEKKPVKEDSNVEEQPAKEDKKEDSKAEQSAKENPKEESKNADTSKKDTESTKESAKSATKIVEFVDVKENGHQPLQCHIISEKEKDTMSNLLPKTVKAKMENGDIVDIDVKWKVDEDPKITNNTVYTYDIQIPEKYSISDQLQVLMDMEQSRLPFIYIKIKEELEKEGHQRPFVREPIYVEPESDDRAGTNANGVEMDYEIYDITNDGSKIIIKGWAYTPDRNQYGKYQGQAGNSVAATKDYILNQHPEYQWGGYCLEVRNASGGVVGSYPLTVTERVDHTELWKGDSRNPTLIDVAFRFDVPLSDLVNKGDLYLNLHYIHPKVGDASFYLMYLASSSSMMSGSYRVDFKADNINSFRTTGVQSFYNKNPWKNGGAVTYNGNNLYYSTNDYFYLSNGTWVEGKRSVDSNRVTWFYTRVRYVGITQSDGWMHRTKADPNGSFYGWIPSSFIQYACSNFRLNVSYSSYKLTLNPNGGVSKGNTGAFTLSPDVIIGYGNWWDIGGYTPTRTGYTFNGWYNAPSGGTKVYNADGTNVPNTAYWDGLKRWIYRGNLTVYAQWTQNTHTNKIDHWAWGFSKNEGNNGAKNAFKLGSSNFNASFNTSYSMDASRGTRIPNGYYIGSTFGTSDISGTWTDYSLGTRVTQKSNAMFYEYRYYPNNYKITYNLNGGTNNSANPSTYNVLYGVTLQNPTKSGYKFLGWYEGNTKVTGINQGANASFSSATDMYNKLAGRRTGNITLTAKWQQLYAIDVNAVLNGQDVTSMDGSWFTFDVYINGSLYANDVADFCTYFAPGTKYEIKDIKPKSRKKYLGTTYNSSLSGTLGSANTGIWLKFVSTHTITLQAPRLHAGTTWKWDIGTKTYTMDYGSKFNMQNYINVFTAPKGYHYGGASTDDWWETAKSGIGSDHGGTYKNNPSNGGSSTFTVTTDMTAQLHYYPNTYTIKYNGNGNTGGSTASSTHSYDATKTLTANGFTKTGYSFVGWNTKADGTGTAYMNKQSVNNLTSTNGATINLYAQWKIVTYTNVINYFICGLKNGEGDTGTSNSIWSMKEPYHFKVNYNGTYSVDRSNGIQIPNGFYLTDNFYVYNKVDGYDQGKYMPMGSTLTQPDKSVYHQFFYHPTNYKITYNLNGGKNNSSNPSTYNVLYGVTLKAPTKTGYTFAGWYEGDKKITGINEGANASFTGNADLYNKLERRRTGNITLTAKWTPIKYTISYEGNGATGGSTPSSNHTYDKPQTLTPNGFHKDGYYFDSWNTKPDGTGTSYKDKEEVKNLTSKDGGTVTLHAQWKPVDYKITYKGNGSTGGTEKTHLYNQKDVETNGYAVKTNKGYTDFVRKNHTFMGWYQNSVVNTKADMAKIYKQGSKLTYSQLLSIHAEQVKKGLVKETDPKVKDIILYAVWDEAPSIDTSNMKKSKFYEGVDVTRADLLNGITASDKIDGSLTNQIIITRIDYSAGKLVNGKKQAAYSQTWANGMPADAKLDTWFMQLDKKDSPVTHTVTYQVKDSAGNITTAKKTIQVVYNEFPVIKATDFQFELKDAQTGKITKDVLLAQAVTNGIISASDTEDGDVKSKIELIDYDANAFKTMKQEGFVPITYRVQDSMGPGGKGKVTLKTVNVNIFIRYKKETVRYVRFINKKYYEKNANLDRNALAGKYDQIALLSVNGGLHPFSVWYTDPTYRALITETFEKTKGTTYVYTKDDIKKMREFVKQHGVGNAKEEDALSKFADIFMTGDYILK